MADLTVPVATDRAFSSPDRAGRGNEPIWDVIELLFFAYRDFIGDPDDVLAKLGFGRALSELGPNAHEAACRFLTAMINADHRDAVLRFIARADRARRPRG